jgi:hypothetical protein
MNLRLVLIDIRGDIGVRDAGNCAECENQRGDRLFHDVLLEKNE